MNIKDSVKIFKALANERRFLILKYLLTRKELTVGEISKLISLSFKSTSRHLSVLVGANLVKARQIDLNRFYSINNSGFSKHLLELLK